MRFPPLLELLRPHQWYKNLIVFVPLVFSNNITSVALWPTAGLTFAAFCFLSGAAYAWNDVMDAPHDRRHPKKRHRPVASGTVRPSIALAWGALWILVGLSLLGWANPPTLLLGAGFLLWQAAYNLILKHQVIWDVLAIGGGFVLRALAGTTALEIGNPTVWLILCTFLFALFLGFAKRRHELLLPPNAAGEEPSPALHRPTLGLYSVDLLDQMTNMVATLLLASYVLYTAFGSSTPWMMFTIPFAIYGVFRYLYLVHRRDWGDEPELLFRDRPTLFNGVAWVGVVALVLAGVPQGLFTWLQRL